MAEIARGGMGIVYRARQLDPPRTVALKMLLPHQLGARDVAERFRFEARALAELDHPAILPVHQFGERDGIPWFTMKLATGGTLAERMRDFAGEWRRIAELVVTLAEAVHYAHGRGVLHRDLKPGNVLFDETGRAYLSDFGLAKLLGADTNLTRSADFLGTPHYVAPEIAAASARAATTASDIYALGAILYELLAGHPPFEAESVPALLRKIVEEEAPRPGRLEFRLQPALPTARPAEAGTPRSIPRDLEVICLKCLAKEPARRYATAHELADDLRRWLGGHAILARASSFGERLWLWARRRPALAGLSVALGLALLAGLVGVLWQWRRAEQHAHASERRLYLADMNLVAQALLINNLDRARALLEAHRPRPGQPDLRAWEWHFFAAEARDLSSFAFRSKVHVRSLDRVSVSPEATTLAVPKAVTHTVELWDLSNCTVRASLPFDATWVRYSGTGRYLFGIGPDWSGLWDFKSGAAIPFNPGDTDFIDAIFSPDDQFVATTTRTAYNSSIVRLQLRTPPDMRVISEKLIDRQSVTRSQRLVFLPDNRQLIMSGGDGNLYFFRVPDLAVEKILPVSSERLTAVAVSPDGTWLAAGSGYTDSYVRVWNLKDNFRLHTLRGHAAWVSAVAFSHDSRLLLSGSADQTARVWDLATEAQIQALRGHQSPVTFAAFVGDGSRIVTGAAGGEVKLWDASTMRPAAIRLTLPPLKSLNLSADHQHFAGLDGEQRVIFGPTTAPQRAAVIVGLGTNCFTAVVSPNATHVVAAESNGVLRLWRRTDQRMFAVTNTSLAKLRHLVFGPGSWFLASLSEDRSVTLWSADLQSLRSWQFPPECLLWANNVVPELDLFVADNMGGPRHVHRMSDGAHVTTLPGEATMTGLAASPDRRTLFISDSAGNVDVWETGSWRRRGRLRGHLMGVGSVAVSPDGRRIATGSSGAEAVKLWDAESLQEVCVLPAYSDYTTQLSFSSDGRSLAYNPPGPEKSLQLFRAP